MIKNKMIIRKVVQLTLKASQSLDATNFQPYLLLYLAYVVTRMAECSVIRVTP